MSPAAIDLFLALLIGHLIGDFVLQTNHMAKNKRRVGVLCVHCLVVTTATYLCVARWDAWQIPLAVFASHAAIDAIKAAIGKDNATTFILDQFAHAAALVTLACYAGDVGGLSEWQMWLGHDVLRIWVVVAGAIVCIRAGGILIGYWVHPYLAEIRDAALVQNDPLQPGRSRGLTNGGRVIGQWERALIFIFVCLGQFGAIGFLVAAKSIFRFGELKDRENRMEAEYITIGTLMSFGWAIVTAWLTWSLREKV